MVRVQILNEVSKDYPDGWRLCLHRVRYVHDDGDINEGYRFMWQRPNNSLQAARGQARIPSLLVAYGLMQAATTAGWGHYTTGDDATARFIETV